MTMIPLHPDPATQELAGRGTGPYPVGERGGGETFYYERVFLDVDANPATARKDSHLQRACRRVVVYNYTDCYVHVVDADMWVPPFIFGAVLPFQSAVTKANVRFEPPPFQAQPAGVVGKRCVFFFTEELLAPNPGIRYTP